VAAGLAAACGWTLQPGAASGRLAPALVLALCGTLVVYNVDRLRDLDQDRLTAPGRSAFVHRHEGALTALCVASAGACLPLALMLPVAAWWACGLALSLGLFHRRLKGRHPVAAVLYVTLAWLAVVVGIPAAALSAPPLAVAAALSALGPAIAANLVASELRGHPPDEAARQRLRVGQLLALAGCLGPLLHPASRPLLAIPLCAWASLRGFRNSERYALLALDGALLAGALTTLAWTLGRGD
jgi:4-hydroxybenzoate polyprenyltransferase